MSEVTGVQQLVPAAKRVLAVNDLGEWTKPAPELYPHQWNWDSCFIAIGISRYDTDRAAAELRSLLRGQWSNGLVPQIVFNPDAGGYFPGPEVWQSERSPDAPAHVATSGITQPPVLATAALAVYRNSSDKRSALQFLREIYPQIVAYHRFFYEYRDPDGDGLIVVVHPWESGLDNSPPYLEAGKGVHLSYRPAYRRLDTLHVSSRHRPTDRDYDLYIYLLERMRDVDWDQRRYLANAPLQVQDVLFNSILCRADLDLAEIASLVGGEPDEPRVWYERTAEVMNARLWDDSAGMYYSYDRVAGRLLNVATVAGFAPLYGGVATALRAARLRGIWLQNPREFWPENAYSVPTTALDSPWFDAENYWRGPVWVNTNWLVIHGLVSYGQSALAARLTQRTLQLVERSGFREYFNPLTGEGYGTDSFGWTAALTIDLVEAVESAP